MCSVNEDDFEGDFALNFKPTIENTVTCIKCKSNNPCIVLRHKDSYCRECFLAATAHKFKSFLGKHHLINPNDKVLIVYKVGHAISTLLHLIRSALNLTTSKKLKLEPCILYIENNYHLTLDQRNEILGAIEKQIKEFNFPVYYITLDAYFSQEDHFSKNISKTVKDTKLKDDDDKNLRQLFTDKMSDTNKLEIIKIIERKLIYRMSAFLNCKHVFSPELSTDVASQLLTSVCMGRGKYLPLDIGICDNRNPKVDIICPLRHVSPKEVAMYNYFNNLNSVHMHLLEVGNNVQGLLKDFIEKLQANFASAVTTILNTGDKLGFGIINNASCKLCEVPIDNPMRELTSCESTMFSKMISNNKSVKFHIPGDVLDRTSNMSNGPQSSDYCFACLQLQHNMSNTMS